MKRRIAMLGATGTIGRATVRALVEQGQDVVCIVRPHARTAPHFAGATIRIADPADPVSLTRDGFAGEQFDAVVSCFFSSTT